MPPDEKKARVSRESRVLILTIIVCVVVLLLLARLRFPEPDIVETTTQPLERLAARASYDALAADIERVEAMIAPSLVVLRTGSRVDTPRWVRDVLLPPDLATDLHHVAALRIDANTAVAAIDPNVGIDGIVGGQTKGTASILATDPVRRFSRVRVPEGPARALTVLPLASLRTPVYVVAVEGTQAGVTLRPVFLGRGDRFSKPRWTRPLLPLGGIAVAPGALLFSLAGEFLGSVVIEDGAPAVAGARDVLDTVEKLATAPSPIPATLGIAVQPLTPMLASATGAERGIVVSEVEADGLAAGVLQPADVITAADGQPVNAPDRFLLDMASHPVGKPVTLSVLRRGDTLEAEVVLAAETGVPAQGSGITFERVRGVGTRVAVAEGKGYALTGLRPRDVVVGTLETRDPTPEQLSRLLEGAQPGSLIVLLVRRNGDQRVVAVRMPAKADASRE